LRMPNKKMMKRYVDTLLGSSSLGERMALDTIPRAHELALMMRNIAEINYFELSSAFVAFSLFSDHMLPLCQLFALSGHCLRCSLRMDATRKKYRKKMRRLKVENERLKEELTSEKNRLIELTSGSLQLKADVVQVTMENQMVEEENTKLKADLEKEKEKTKGLRGRNVMLHNDLYDRSLKNERLHSELNETYQKLTKGKEIEEMFSMPSTSESIVIRPIPTSSAFEAPLVADAPLPP
ncbi:hypothetical protein Dimus_005059, partial [Dionaea muscipula]